MNEIQKSAEILLGNGKKRICKIQLKFHFLCTTKHNRKLKHSTWHVLYNLLTHHTLSIDTKIFYFISDVR